MAKKAKTRVPIPPEVQAAVVAESQRRCCICWVLEHKDSIVLGQIAHLDRDPSNNEKDNLAYLCLTHHAMYDPQQTQAKGYTALEVKQYREQMIMELRGGPQLGSARPGIVPAIQAGGSISAGGDIIVGTVTQHITKPVRGRKIPPPSLPGTVVDDHRKYNYLNYLAKRYNEFKAWECKKHNEKFSGGVIYKTFENAMKHPVRHTPLERFDEAVAYLQTRIKNTMLGRIKAKEGNRLFESFEEYPG